jgi:hypothetical protein
VSIRYTERLAEAGIEPSVGSVGDSHDNALAETINGLYKAEVIHRRGVWRNPRAVEMAMLELVDCSISGGCSNRPAPFHRLRPKPLTICNSMRRAWPRDSNQQASGIPGCSFIFWTWHLYPSRVP